MFCVGLVRLIVSAFVVESRSVRISVANAGLNLSYNFQNSPLLKYEIREYKLYLEIVKFNDK